MIKAEACSKWSEKKETSMNTFLTTHVMFIRKVDHEKGYQK